MPRPRVRVPLSPPNAPVAQRIERRRPKSRVGGSNPSRGTIKIHGRRRLLPARSAAQTGAAQIGATHRRSVAQPGQSAGLQNQWPGVRILPLLPILGTEKAPGCNRGPLVFRVCRHFADILFDDHLHRPLFDPWSKCLLKSDDRLFL